MHNFNLLYYMLNIVASESAFKRTMADKKRLLFSILAFIVSFHLCFCQPGLPTDFPYVFCSVSVLSYVLCIVFLSYMCTPCCGFILQQGVLFLNVYFPWDCSAIARKFFLAFYRPNGTSFTIRNQNLRKNRISSLIDVG